LTPPERGATLSRMEKPSKPAPAGAARGAEAATRREARLAAALRQNLGRRKAQARQREDEAQQDKD
jgi:hypothetical protein